MKYALGDRVRIRPGATYSRFTGDAVGEIVGIHFDAGAAAEPLYVVRFAPGISPWCDRTMNLADEMEPATESEVSA